MKPIHSRAGILVAIVGFAGAGNAIAQTVDFADFTNISPLTLNGETGTLGNPVFFNGANVLRMTDGTGQSGSAFLTNPISLAADASFSTFFSFQLSDGEGIGTPPGADGLVFTIQTVANTAGGGGGGIGYAGLANSVGIEFDTFFNASNPPDPDGNHVGIDIAGNVTSIATASVAPPFNDGSVWYAWADYNGATDLLEVRVSQSPNRPAAATLSSMVDIPTVLTQTSAFIGFTSGTGAGANDHDIRSWRFIPAFQPIGSPMPRPVPLNPLAMLLLVAVLSWIGLRVLRRQTR